MKKIYKEPKEIIIELGLQGQLLDVSGNGPSDGLDTQPGENKDPEDGETMARTHGNLWDSQW